MGRTVSELMSANISNAIRNQETWGNVLIIANSYGATGDGTTNSTTAIQAAINAAIAAGKNEVYFLPGDYIYTTLTNTDGIVFWGDGVTVSGSPAIPVVAVAQLADMVLNIKSFGATGDGSTDDTAAIQAAIVFAENNDMTLLFPNDSPCKITSTLNITKSIRFKGEGSGFHLVPYISDGSPAIYVFADSAPYIKLLIDGLAIDGTNSDGDGIQLDAQSQFELSRVKCHNFSSGAGIWSKTSMLARFYNCDCIANLYGIRTDGTPNVDFNNDFHVIGGDYEQNGDTGLKLNGQNIILDGVNVEGQPVGIDIGELYTCRSVSIRNPYMEAVSSKMIKLTNCFQVDIKNPYDNVFSGSGAAYEFTRCRDMTVEGLTQDIDLISAVRVNLINCTGDVSQNASLGVREFKSDLEFNSHAQNLTSFGVTIGQKENILVQSENFSSGSWTKQNITISQDTNVRNPAGNLDSTKMLGSTTGARVFQTRTQNISTGEKLFCSASVLAGDSDDFRIQIIVTKTDDSQVTITDTTLQSSTASRWIRWKTSFTLEYDIKNIIMYLYPCPTTSNKFTYFMYPQICRGEDMPYVKTASSSVFNRRNGIFTTSAGKATLTGATTTVTNENVTGSYSVIILTPANAAAATLLNTSNVFATTTSGVNGEFVINANGGTPAGTEEFYYFVLN